MLLSRPPRRVKSSLKLYARNSSRWPRKPRAGNLFLSLSLSCFEWIGSAAAFILLSRASEQSISGSECEEIPHGKERDSRSKRGKEAKRNQIKAKASEALQSQEWGQMALYSLTYMQRRGEVRWGWHRFFFFAPRTETAKKLLCKKTRKLFFLSFSDWL